MAWTVDGDSLDWRVDIDIASAKIDANLTDKDVFIDLNDLGADFWDNVKSDGGDIRATLSDGTTRIPLELKEFNSTIDTGQVYIKVSSISSSTDTTIYLYWGNATLSQPAPAATYGSENVWDSNSSLVAHLNELGDGTADEYKDSTSNANHGVGGVISPDYIPSRATGLAGYCQDMTGTTGARDHINFGTDSSIDPGGAFTLEMFIYPHVVNQHSVFFIRSQSGGGSLSFEFRFNTSGNIVFWINGDSQTTTSVAISANTWQHVALTYDGTSGATGIKVYVDGTEQTSAQHNSGTMGTNASSPVTIGAMAYSPSYNYFNGLQEEARISLTDRAAAWLKATYENFVNTASFYTIRTYEQAPGAFIPKIIIF